MRQSELFTKTRREAPKDEVAKNAELLIRAGYIHKEMAGVYSFLPLGLRVLNNITTIVREEMNAIGGQEVLLSALQPKELWEKTDRWSDKVVDNWFKSTLVDGGDVGFGHTHEEPLTSLLTEHLVSHRDLPKAVYQIQSKFRNELRAKSGLLRGREFLMKDMYSFVRSEEELDAFHEKAAKSYERIFERAGIGERTFRTYASGGTFSKWSDEFQMLCDAGEDTIYLDREGKRAVNREVYSAEVLKELNLHEGALEEVKAIEVGNIFKLGTRFSEPLGLTVTDEGGVRTPVLMGCYGLGISRLMGAVAEALSDEKGLIWPKAIAPFTMHLIDLSGGEERVKGEAEALYQKLTKRGTSMLFDDRELSAGEKFADADLLGIPLRVVVSKKTVEAKKFEVSERKSGELTLVSEDELFSR